MRELSRKELVRSARRSSIAGEAEYAFSHVLARDVAYGSLPRASRAARHVAAARWIEAKSADRIEDQADILAHHYSTALELARAAGQVEWAAELETPAFRFLSLAGERALGLDTAAALASLERALALAPPGHPERAAALARFGETAFQAGRYGEAATALDEAIARSREAGDLPAAARAMGLLSPVLSKLGDARAFTLPAEALALVEPLGSSPELVAALTEVARADALAGRSGTAIRVADRALEVAASLGLSRPARALGYRGSARADAGDAGGLDDFRAAIALAVAAGQGREAALLHYNLSEQLAMFEGPAPAFDVARAGLAYAEARGLAEIADVLSVNLIDPDRGEFAETLALAARIAPRLEAAGDVFALLSVREIEAIVRAIRGDARLAVPWLGWLVSAARATAGPQRILRSLASAASARAALGERAAAAALLAEVEAFPAARGDADYAKLLPMMVRTALAIGDPGLAERMVDGFEPRHPYGDHALVATTAMLAEARGDPAALPVYADAAGRWERFGVVPERAFALLGQGRCLAALGRPSEARGPLGEARAVFERLGAAPALVEVDAILSTVS
jgi:tetratricopeptide (TPR) repeat protein